MSMALRRDFAADRWTVFRRTLRLRGVDLTGATMAMQLRKHRDAEGAPAVELGMAANLDAAGLFIFYAGTATVAAHVAAGRLAGVPKGMRPEQLLSLTLMSIRIEQAVIELCPSAMAWDLHVTPVDGEAEVWIYGLFTVVGGVTRDA